MDISSRVAQGLLSIGAVFLRPQEPFTWAAASKARSIAITASFSPPPPCVRQSSAPLRTRYTVSFRRRRF